MEGTEPHLGRSPLSLPFTAARENLRPTNFNAILSQTLQETCPQPPSRHVKSRARAAKTHQSPDVRRIPRRTRSEWEAARNERSNFITLVWSPL